MDNEIYVILSTIADWFGLLVKVNLECEEH